MKNLKFTKKLAISKEQLFDYFTRPRLLEQWAAPEGMTLKIPILESKEGGKYRWEHSSDKGLYVCTGYFKEFVPNQRLVQIDSVKDPEGKIIFENLKSVTEFRSVGNETEIKITQGEFKDDKAAEECEQSWNQCFNKLEQLIGQSDQHISSQSL